MLFFFSPCHDAAWQPVAQLPNLNQLVLLPGLSHVILVKLQRKWQWFHWWLGNNEDNLDDLIWALDVPHSNFRDRTSLQDFLGGQECYSELRWNVGALHQLWLKCGVIPHMLVQGGVSELLFLGLYPHCHCSVLIWFKATHCLDSSITWWRGALLPQGQTREIFTTSSLYNIYLNLFVL